MKVAALKRLCNKDCNIISASPFLTMQNGCVSFSFHSLPFFLPSYSVIAGDSAQTGFQVKSLCLAGGSQGSRDNISQY